MSQNPVYNAGDVYVDRTLVKIGGVSYPVNGIGSVQIQDPDRSTRYGWTVVVGIVAAIFLFQKESWGFGLFLGAIAVWIYVSAQGMNYVLLLRTASGDQQALKSRDQRLVHRVKDAIEEAVRQSG